MINLIRLQFRRVSYCGSMFAALLYLGAARFENGTYAFLLDRPIVFAISVLIMATGFAVCLAITLPIMVQIPLLRELRIMPEFLMTWGVLYYGLLVDGIQMLPDSMEPIATISAFVLYWGTVQGPLLDRFDLRLLSKERSSFVTSTDRTDLWERLRPGRGPIETHWDALLADAEIDPVDPARVFVKYRHGSGTFEHQEITYLDETPNSHFLYHYRNPVEGSRQALVEGEFEAWLKDLRNGKTRVTIENRRHAVTPNLAIAMWFDNLERDRVVYAHNRMENRWDGTLSGAIRRKVLSFS